MIFSLALASLTGHRARALLAALGVAVSAAMLLDMVMLSSGMRESFRRLLDDGGFHIRVTPKGTVPFDTDASIADASHVAAQLRAIAGVTMVSPVLGASLHVPRGESAVAAFALGVEPAVQRDYTVVEGTDLLAPDALAANDAFLTAAGAGLGDTLDVAVGYDPQLRGYAGQRRVVVTARVHFRYLSDEQRAVAIPLATLQAMGATESRDRVSLLMVRVGEGVDPERVRADIVRAIPRVSAISTAGAIALAEQRLSYFRQLALILGAVSLVVGFLLVTTLMTVSVNERVGEIAVMRAIGISRLRVVQQIAVEGMALTLVGAIVGLALGLVSARYLDSILSQFPGLPDAIDFFLFQPMAVAKAFGLLCVSGIAAALYPSWRAASLPIAGTLRREIRRVMPLVSTRSLGRDYPHPAGTVRAVRALDLDIDAGEYVAIVGPSGCGKSTLLNLLGAIDRPTSGSVTIHGSDIGAMRDRPATRFRLDHIGFVFQRFYLMPVLTARENVELPMSEARVPKAERERRARELLSYVGLSARERHRPSELSGGEQQRVAIARALANRPLLLLADEPTGELDAKTGAEIIALLARLSADGTTIIVVTHDEMLARAAGRVIHMLDGRVVRDELAPDAGPRSAVAP